MQGQMQDFVEAFRRRIEVQITYSQNLQEVSRSLDKHIKPGTDLSTSFICSAFKVEHERRSHQSLELAESLKTEIEQICSEYLQSQTAAFSRIEKEITKYYKDGQTYTQNHKKSLENLQNMNKMMEESFITKQIINYSTGQQKKSKLKSKMLESSKESKQCEKNYLNSVKDYNTFVATFNTNIGTHLDQSEKIIREQVIIQGDCLRKLIIAEVSMFKNIEYDLLNICKQMEVLDTQRNVEVFVDQQKYSLANRVIPEERDDEPKRSSTETIISPSLEQKGVIGKSMLSQSIYYVEEGYFDWMASNKGNKQLRELINKVWRIFRSKQHLETFIKKEQLNEQEKSTNQSSSMSKIQSTPTNDEKQWEDELKETILTFKILHPPNLNSPKKVEKAPKHQKIYQTFIEIIRMIAFLWNSEEIDSQLLNNTLNSLEGHLQKHHLYRLIAYMFIQEYRLQHQLIFRSSNHAKICAKIIRTILKESHKKNDVFIARGLLGLIFTFYWTEEKEKTKKLMNLIPQLYQCQIWKKSDFWDAAIFETTFEEMTSFSIKKGETQAETILREKNILFNQLASYCNYMIMLGVSAKIVKLTVGRYCRLYDLTEYQNLELSKMIKDTIKQFKQAYRSSGKLEKERSVIGD